MPAATGHSNTSFDPDCRRCPRLAAYLDECRLQHPDYHARPVAAFGVARPSLMVVGLAPGMHGANRSGRPFTGDYAGILLYRCLHRQGFASHPHSEHLTDGLRLLRCRISNAVKCVPPENKPTSDEINCCNSILAGELKSLPKGTVILALGVIAHRAILKALDLRPASHRPFGHGREYPLARERVLLDSYHCSRYNTQTRRLNEAMFDAILVRARKLIDQN